MSAAFVRIVFPLSLLLALLVSVSEAGILLPHKVHVVVINDLSGNKPLTLHCYKSKGGKRDLGPHTVFPGKTYDFTFRPRLIGPTKYSCSFEWNGGFVKWFDLYVKERDHKKCRNCSWSVREDKICRFNYDTHAYTDCFLWKQH